MANYLRPGTFINEAPMTNPSIGGSQTVAAFLGITQRGPANVAVKVGSWTDYVNKYAYGLSSALYASGYNGYGVYGFFNNGGNAFYQVRVTASGAAAASYTYVDSQGTPANVLKITASFVMPDNSLVDDPGIWGNQISVNTVVNAVNASNYDITVKYGGVAVETFKNCSLISTDPQFVETVVNTFSKYIRVQRLGTTTINPTLLGSDKAFTGGVDGLPAASDFTTQLSVLDVVSDDVNIIVCPDCQTTAFIQAAYAKAVAYQAYFVTDANLTDTVASAVTLRGSLSSDSAALYFPWILVYDPIATNKTQPTKYVPCAGHVAGRYVNTDFTRGTFKAPAGITDGVINGALGTKVAFTTTDEDTLNSNQINIIKPIKNVGVVIYGTRGLTTSNTMYVPVRRELYKIERDVKAGTRWAVFEPNNNQTWSKLTNTIRAYLFNEMQAGAFAGVKTDGSDSFFVICDGTNNTSSTINQGLINIQIGVAQVKPGEFIVINIGQIQ